MEKITKTAGKRRPYVVQKLTMTKGGQSEPLYQEIRNYIIDPESTNQNDGLYMSENLGLYRFWMAADFGEWIYYLPETGTYVAANVEGQVLHIAQIFGKVQTEIPRLARSFGEEVKEVVLGYTPACREMFQVRERREEDETLFILGEDLRRIERDKMMFPILSHA